MAGPLYLLELSYIFPMATLTRQQYINVLFTFSSHEEKNRSLNQTYVCLLKLSSSLKADGAVLVFEYMYMCLLESGSQGSSGKSSLFY